MFLFLRTMEAYGPILIGTILLFKQHHRGAYPFPALLPHAFIVAGLFRFLVFLPVIIGIGNVLPHLVLVSTLMFTGVQYFGVACYVGVQIHFLTGVRAERVAMMLGVLIAAMVGAAQYVFFLRLPFPEAVLFPWQPAFLLVFLGGAFTWLVAFMILSVVQLITSRLPLAALSTIHFGLGLLLIAGLLLEATHVQPPALFETFLSSVPFVAISFVIIAIFIQLYIALSPGVVIDARTKRPVSLAVIRIFRASDQKLVGSAISDANGLYGFLLTPGTYTISVTAPGYSFPARAAFGYHGETRTFKRYTVLGFDIFLDPVV